MEIVNVQANSVEVGGDVACFIGCGGLCFISQGVATAMALALVAL